MREEIGELEKFKPDSEKLGILGLCAKFKLLDKERCVRLVRHDSKYASACGFGSTSSGRGRGGGFVPTALPTTTITSMQTKAAEIMGISTASMTTSPVNALINGINASPDISDPSERDATVEVGIYRRMINTYNAPNVLHPDVASFIDALADRNRFREIVDAVRVYHAASLSRSTVMISLLDRVPQYYGRPVTDAYNQTRATALKNEALQRYDIVVVPLPPETVVQPSYVITGPMISTNGSLAHPYAIHAYGMNLESRDTAAARSITPLIDANETQTVAEIFYNYYGHMFTLIIEAALAEASAQDKFPYINIPLIGQGAFMQSITSQKMKIMLRQVIYDTLHNIVESKTDTAPELKVVYRIFDRHAITTRDTANLQTVAGPNHGNLFSWRDDYAPTNGSQYIAFLVNAWDDKSWVGNGQFHDPTIDGMFVAMARNMGFANASFLHNPLISFSREERQDDILKSVDNFRPDQKTVHNVSNCALEVENRRVNINDLTRYRISRETDICNAMLTSNLYTEIMFKSPPNKLQAVRVTSSILSSSYNYYLFDNFNIELQSLPEAFTTPTFALGYSVRREDDGQMDKIRLICESGNDIMLINPYGPSDSPYTLNAMEKRSIHENAALIVPYPVR